MTGGHWALTSTGVENWVRVETLVLKPITKHVIAVPYIWLLCQLAFHLTLLKVGAISSMFAFSFTEKERRRGGPNPLATLEMNILNSITCPIPSNVHYRSLSTFLSLTFVCMLQGGKDNFEGSAGGQLQVFNANTWISSSSKIKIKLK